MTTTLSNITYAVASALGIVVEGTATGGSTTSIVDSINLTQADNYWRYGTAWILYDAGGLHASPEGKFAAISASTNSATSVTIATVTDAVAAGDRYAVGRKRYPLGKLTEKVNEALRSLGAIEMTDTTTLDTASNTVEYTLPVGANHDLRQVWLNGASGETDIQLEGWSIEKSATGSGNLLALPLTLDAGSDIKLVYTGPHAELQVYSDKLDDSINPQLVVCKAAIGCLLWRRQRIGDDDGELTQQLNHFQDELINMIAKDPVRLPTKTGKKLILSREKRLY